MTQRLDLPPLPDTDTWRPLATETYWNFQPTAAQHSWDVEYYQYYRLHFQKWQESSWEKVNARYFCDGRSERMDDAFEPALDWPWVHTLRKGVPSQHLDIAPAADAPPREVEVLEIRIRTGSVVRARIFAESNPKVKLQILDDYCAAWY